MGMWMLAEGNHKATLIIKQYHTKDGPLLIYVGNFVTTTYLSNNQLLLKVVSGLYSIQTESTCNTCHTHFDF